MITIVANGSTGLAGLWGLASDPPSCLAEDFDSSIIVETAIDL